MVQYFLSERFTLLALDGFRILVSRITPFKITKGIYKWKRKEGCQSTQELMLNYCLLYLYSSGSSTSTTILLTHHWTIEFEYKKQLLDVYNLKDDVSIHNLHSKSTFCQVPLLRSWSDWPEQFLLNTIPKPLPAWRLERSFYVLRCLEELQGYFSIIPIVVVRLVQCIPLMRIISIIECSKFELFSEII